MSSPGITTESWFQPYFNLAEAMASVKVTEQKVILCGEYGVGKSSLFRRYANNSFVSSSDRKSTLGLDNIDKEYTVDDRRIRVSFTF